ncbi:hypothetical protein B7P43_G17610 [Cryptotermes secundus]|uniref:Integrase p58-like C-terminal domain-containing protein n=1 Tax=Cryptotermes secundus TaxID=105785 RepID=A0A2J7RIW1_9NEOP|nr:hypothetical protein B7P43_G17610 [Cryptotermes secundus]
MRLPTEDDLTTARFVNKQAGDGQDSIQSHLDTLAERLEEAYRVAKENNRIGRERQKRQYDKGTRITIFQPGEMIYLRVTTKQKRACPKFRLKWRGPYEVVRRLSDLNYLIRIARNKEIVVNVNKMKRGHKNLDPSSFKATDIPTPESGNVPPMETTDGRDETQDPTWEPARRQEIQPTTNDSTDTREEPRTRYWLRSRPAETPIVCDSPPSPTVEGQADTDATEAEPSTSPVVEVVEERGGEDSDTAPPRYNFRPLPGRKI